MNVVFTGCGSLLILVLSAATASAQGARARNPNTDARVNADQVTARLMTFDRNRDGRVAIEELSERIQGLVARGDLGGDGALDTLEIRTLVDFSQQVPTTAQAPIFRMTIRAPQGGGYGFADEVGQTSRSHIENSIDDLRLSPWVNSEAKRLAAVFTEELDAAAFANFRQAVAPMLTGKQLATFEADVKRTMNSPAFNASSADRAVGGFVVGDPPDTILRRLQLTPEQTKTALSAIEAFKADRQLNDTRRATLVTRVSHLLIYEDRDDLRAALARRPLVKESGLRRF